MMNHTLRCFKNRSDFWKRGSFMMIKGLDSDKVSDETHRICFYIWLRTSRREK